MDGTALMALGPFISYSVLPSLMAVVAGMLVQEHVARLVQGKVPDGWEEEMQGADELGEEVDGSELGKSSSEEIGEAPSEVTEDEPNGAADESESDDDEIEPETGTGSNDEG